MNKTSGRNITYYRKKDPSQVIKEIKINETSLNWFPSGRKASVNLFLYLRNDTDRPLTSIPISLPSGGSDSPEDLNLNAYDQYGSIDKNRINTTYTYPGRILISVGSNKVLKPIEKTSCSCRGILI
ncbi:MAG: hypothetical protein ACP5UZ_01935 [Thermoplasmata archaeon]